MGLGLLLLCPRRVGGGGGLGRSVLSSSDVHSDPDVAWSSDDDADELPSDSSSPVVMVLGIGGLRLGGSEFVVPLLLLLLVL